MEVEAQSQVKLDGSQARSWWQCKGNVIYGPFGEPINFVLHFEEENPAMRELWRLWATYVGNDFLGECYNILKFVIRINCAVN